MTPTPAAARTRPTAARTRPAWLLALLLVAVALAGCGDDGGGSRDGDGGTGPDGGTGDGDGGPGDGDDGSDGTDGPVRVPLLTDFHFSDCTGFSFYQEADHDEVQALLPEGFTALRVEGDTDLAPQGYLRMELYQCAAFNTETVAINDTWYGHLHTWIEPPAAYPDVTADRYEYTFQMLAGEDIMAQLWPAARYPTHNGSAAQNLTDVAGLAGLLEASLGDYLLEAPLVAMADSDTGTLARFTVTDAGERLIWTGSFETPRTHAGQGELQVPAESPFAGFGRVQADALNGPVVYGDGASFTDNLLVIEIP